MNSTLLEILAVGIYLVMLVMAFAWLIVLPAIGLLYVTGYIGGPL